MSEESIISQAELDANKKARDDKLTHRTEQLVKSNQNNLVHDHSVKKKPLFNGIVHPDSFKEGHPIYDVLKRVRDKKVKEL